MAERHTLIPRRIKVAGVRKAIEKRERNRDLFNDELIDKVAEQGKPGSGENEPRRGVWIR